MFVSYLGTIQNAYLCTRLESRHIPISYVLCDFVPAERKRNVGLKLINTHTTVFFSTVRNLSLHPIVHHKQ